jgi:hypothetical protein
MWASFAVGGNAGKIRPDPFQEKVVTYECKEKCKKEFGIASVTNGPKGSLDILIRPAEEPQESFLSAFGKWWRGGYRQVPKFGTPLRGVQAEALDTSAPQCFGIGGYKRMKQD